MWRPDPTTPVLDEQSFRLLRDLVHRHSGLWFRDDAMYLVERRLGPRLQALGLRDFEAYHQHLLFSPERAEELEGAVELLTTNETYLYREPLQLQAFRTEILPRVARELAGRRQLRILSAGCSTGEEPYTIAVLVKESRLFAGWDVEIVGADLSRRCIAQAKLGAYPESAFRSPEAEVLRPWFELRGGKWIVAEELRRSVRFVRENLVAPRALSTVGLLDVVLCRNVLIYFDADARKRALRRLYERMRGGGWLLLGHSESLLGSTADFELEHLREDLVYRRPAGPVGAGPEDGA
ncbi:MAG: protein-glutamate O-methyltransferase CheR [Anaeromyxobacteraceae bacterium]